MSKANQGAVDLDEMASPVDAESPDAPYNPGVFELRRRIGLMAEEIRTARQNEEAFKMYDSAVTWLLEEAAAIAGFEMTDRFHAIHEGAVTVEEVDSLGYEEIRARRVAVGEVSE